MANSGIFLVLCFTIAASGVPDQAKPALSDAERHHLQCYVKRLLFDNKSEGRYCCIQPDAAKKSCAIVSSSGVMLKFNLGAEIDKHDYVIRLNNAPIQNYSNYVGQKISIRFGHKGAPYHGEPPEYHINEQYYKCKTLNWFRGKYEIRRSQYDAFVGGFPDLQVVPYHCESYVVMKLLRNIFPGMLGRRIQGNADPTSGASAIILALSSCEKVVLYGMTNTLYDDDISYHYYGPFKKRHRTDHFSFDAEKDLWWRLSGTPVSEAIRQGWVTLPGLRSVSGCENVSSTPPLFVVPWQEEGKSPQVELMLREKQLTLLQQLKENWTKKDRQHYLRMLKHYETLNRSERMLFTTRLHYKQLEDVERLLQEHHPSLRLQHIVYRSGEKTRSRKEKANRARKKKKKEQALQAKRLELSVVMLVSFLLTFSFLYAATRYFCRKPKNKHNE